MDFLHEAMPSLYRAMFSITIQQLFMLVASRLSLRDNTVCRHY